MSFENKNVSETLENLNITTSTPSADEMFGEILEMKDNVPKNKMIDKADINTINAGLNRYMLAMYEATKPYKSSLYSMIETDDCKSTSGEDKGIGRGSVGGPTECI